MTDRMHEPLPEQTGLEAQRVERRKVPWRLIGAALLAALITVFAVQNTQSVEVNYLWFNTDGPLIIVILISFVAAWILSDIFSWWWRRRKKAKEG